MKIIVGEVTEVRGTRITLRTNETSNKEVIFRDGQLFKGVSIREFLIVRRGFKDIVCIVEGEYLDEKLSTSIEPNLSPNFIRKVDLKPIGYFENETFFEGIKFLPMIMDKAFLASEVQIKSIFNKNNTDEFVIGNLVKEQIPANLPWEKIFNGHMGIFGNTGSGKSNTLTNLYTTLFQKKKKSIQGKSRFIVLDFNGEYTGRQLLDDTDKQVFILGTKTQVGDKVPISEKQFWDPETLCLLFKATQNTQSPFIKRMVSGRNRYKDNKDSLNYYIKKTFEKNFQAQAQRRESIDLLTTISKKIGLSDIEVVLTSLSWHSKDSCFYHQPSKQYFNGGETSEAYTSLFSTPVNKIDVGNISFFTELIVRVNLQLINDLLAGYVQFEHIQPLLKRIEALESSLENVIDIGNADENNSLLTVISLRQCNQEIKKIIPLLIAKHLYDKHKNDVKAPPNKTVHLIIDEAHNILSQQSLREEESWKDYRLELFEEIIKEGRKFGFFLTISSQRPADISPTIMSQVHNFFIHRLVNDRDLLLLDNTISTLDSLSKGMIPTLPKGSCILTGTAFELPLLIQADLLSSDKRPDSDDVNLQVLWN